MTESVEIVDRRPAKGQRSHHVYDALVETLESGKAIRFPLADRSLNSWRSTLYLFAKNRGARCHLRQDGASHLIAWLEPREE